MSGPNIAYLLNPWESSYFLWSFELMFASIFADTEISEANVEYGVRVAVVRHFKIHWNIVSGEIL